MRIASLLSPPDRRVLTPGPLPLALAVALALCLAPDARAQDDPTRSAGAGKGAPAADKGESPGDFEEHLDRSPADELEFPEPRETIFEPWLRLEMGTWFARIEGRVESTPALRGRGFNLRSTLGLRGEDGYEVLLTPRISIQPLDWLAIRGDFTWAVWRGHGALAQGELRGFRHTLFAGELRSKHEFYTGDAEIDFIPLDREHFRLSIPIGFRYVSLRTRIEEVETRTRDAERTEGYLPYIGLKLELRPIRQLGIFAHGKVGGWSDFSAERDHRDGHLRLLEDSAAFLDAQAGLRLRLGDQLEFEAGYRVLAIDLHYEQHDESANFSLAGPYAQGALSF